MIRPARPTLAEVPLADLSFSFGGALGPRGAEITDVVKLGSTRFWDAWLKNSQSARDYLKSERLIEDSGGTCTFEKK